MCYIGGKNLVLKIIFKTKFYMTISQEGKPNRINTFLKNRISSYP